jgi:hypothetical protein
LAYSRLVSFGGIRIKQYHMRSTDSLGVDVLEEIVATIQSVSTELERNQTERNGLNLVC